MLFYMSAIVDVSKMYSKDFRIPIVKPPAVLAVVLAALSVVFSVILDPSGDRILSPSCIVD